VRINGDGDTLWTRRHATVGKDIAKAVTVLTDGSIVWAGQWNSASAAMGKCTPTGTGCFSQNSSAGIFSTRFQKEIFNIPVLHLVNPHSRPDTLNQAGSIAFNSLCVNSIADQESHQLIPEVFPVPAKSGHFTVQSAYPIEFIRLYNLQGISYTYPVNGLSTFQISESKPGFYFLQIFTTNGTFSRALIVEK
jgi:hypothetical protein